MDDDWSHELRMLRARAYGPAADILDDPDALARLLSLRLLPAAGRQQALADYAALVPLEEPEHWLALRCAGTPSGSEATLAKQHAEMAWLNGAGELAVLLDAGLQVLRRDGVAPDTLAPQQTMRVLRRVGSSDATDAPAGTALRALVQFASGDVAGAEQSLASLPPNTPCPLRHFQNWLLATKAADPAELATQRGLAYVRLGIAEAARSCLGAAQTPTASLCAWLLAPENGTEQLPSELPPHAWADAAEIVRGDRTMIDRLLAAARDAGAAGDLVRSASRNLNAFGTRPVRSRCAARTRASGGFDR